jgi:hypothetical protein
MNWAAGRATRTRHVRNLPARNGTASEPYSFTSSDCGVMKSWLPCRRIIFNELIPKLWR